MVAVLKMTFTFMHPPTVVRKRRDRTNICVRTLHFPIFDKPTIAIFEKNILQICASLLHTLVYIFPYAVKIDKNKLFSPKNFFDLFRHIYMSPDSPNSLITLFCLPEFRKLKKVENMPM